MNPSFFFPFRNRRLSSFVDNLISLRLKWLKSNEHLQSEWISWSGKSDHTPPVERYSYPLDKDEGEERNDGNTWVSNATVGIPPFTTEKQKHFTVLWDALVSITWLWPKTKTFHCLVGNIFSMGYHLQIFVMSIERQPKGDELDHFNSKNQSNKTVLSISLLLHSWKEQFSTCCGPLFTLGRMTMNPVILEGWEN